MLGFDLHGKTIGIIGTGNIGKTFAKIAKGFVCKVLVFDVVINTEMEQGGVTFVSLETIFKESDIISLHCPLNMNTKYIIDKKSLSLMKTNVMIIHTSRGALIQTSDVVQALKKKKSRLFRN